MMNTTYFKEEENGLVDMEQVVLTAEQQKDIEKLSRVKKAGKGSYYRFLYYDHFSLEQRLIAYDGNTIMTLKVDTLAVGDRYAWYANGKLFLSEVDVRPPYLDTINADYWKASNEVYNMVLSGSYSKNVPLMMATLGVPFDLRHTDLMKGESWTAYAPFFGDVYKFESERFTLYLTDLRVLVS